jgi:hypothetical protein
MLSEVKICRALWKNGTPVPISESEMPIGASILLLKMPSVVFFIISHDSWWVPVRHPRGILGKNENNYFSSVALTSGIVHIACMYLYKVTNGKTTASWILVPENICKHKLFKLEYFLGSQVLFTNMFLLRFQMVFPICSPCVLYFSPSCFVTTFLIILLPQSCVL